MKNIFVIITMVLFLSACGPKKSDVVAVKVGDEIYATDSAAAESLADSNSKDEIVCKRVAKTGSRLTTRVCTTRKQMELDRAEDKRRISDNIQHNATINAINKKGG